MRRLLVLLALLLMPSLASAQNGGFIHYWPPAGSGVGGGGGDLLDGTLCTDSEGFLVRTASGTCTVRILAAGTGVSLANPAGTAGNPTISVDTAILAQFTSGTGAASATGSIGTWYHETDSGLVSTYSNTDTLATMMTTQTHFIDEDSFATNSATKVPSQQSVKAYVDAQAGGSLDLATQVDTVEEFIGSTVVTNGMIGQWGWSQAVYATGTNVGNPGNTNHPGTWELLSHATNDNSGAHIFALPVLDSTFLTDANWTLESYVCFGFSGDGVANSHFAFGLTETAGSSFFSKTGFVGFVRNTDNSDTTFVGVTCDSDTTGCGEADDQTNQKAIDSTITPADNGCYRFRIRNSTTEGPGSTRLIGMRVNDETELTWCSSTCGEDLTQVPAGDMAIAFGYLTLTTTEVKSVAIDAVRLTATVDRY